MYAIKWISDNPITKNKACGIISIRDNVHNTANVLVFNTPEEAEEQIEIFKKTASSTVSFEVVSIEKEQMA